jgi:hypothetical protein
MVPGTNRLRLISLLGLFAGIGLMLSPLLRAQVPWGMDPQTAPGSQRNAVNSVQSQVNWLQNATRTAPNYGAGGYGLLLQQFDMLCGAYDGFKHTLTPRQLDYGANDLAELDAGLGIIREAFDNYQEEIADGRAGASATRNLCSVLRQSTALWSQEFKRDCNRLRVGFP